MRRIAGVSELAVAGGLLFALLEPTTVSAQGVAQCNRCHGDASFLVGKGDSAAADSVLYVPATRLAETAHGGIGCAACHVGYDQRYPHAPNPSALAPEQLVRFESPVGGLWVRSCGDCHGQVLEDVAASVHRGAGEVERVAGACVECHGYHDVYAASDRRSSVHALNEIATCAVCHAAGGDAEAMERVEGRDVVAEYRATVHGRAVAGGLAVAATCSDCHHAHLIQPPTSRASSVSRDSVPVTCGQCHEGVLEIYQAARHGQRLREESAGAPPADNPAPVCVDCHTSHEITRVDEPRWDADIVTECGVCHEALYETYTHSYHGKTTLLGGELAARCADCHTAHNVRPASDPLSSVSAGNIVETCRACHAGATQSFAQYYPHADHGDRDRYPVLFWAATAMTALLVGVFGFFGIHTGLWAVRALIERARVGGGTGGGEGRE
ncbi:MAG: hypothetical protein HY701_09155 [Gemmatimonadetes bacterium]|nr:hypothetical protein [Gemmatimonadota bacterium]